MQKKIFLFLLIGISGLFLSLFIINIALAVEIKPPLKWTSFEQLLNAIIDFLIKLALVVVPLVIVIAGYFFVASGGDPAKVTQARNMVLWALVGLLILLMAKGIIVLIEQVFGV